MTEDAKILEGQLRECFGRVVYTHKTQEICADLLLKRYAAIKVWQIVLSALVTGGILTTLLGEWRITATCISAALSAALLALNTYVKDNDLGATAEKHRRAATDIWLVREKYEGLLTDLRSGTLSMNDAKNARDALLIELRNAYASAPSTNPNAYQKAQHALKSAEDMTFSDGEIDAFLPKELKRNV